MPLLPGAEPFGRDGGPIGVLFCHGFTGTPATMTPWAEAVAAAGYTVAVPRLPGHGTTWQELNTTRWPDWYAEIEHAFDALRGRCEQVFVAGLSMGGTLALRLAEQRGDQVAGLLLVNPSLLTLNRMATLLPVLSRIRASRGSLGGDIKKQQTEEPSYGRTPLRALNSLRRFWAVVRPGLARVTQPMLLFHSSVDHVVEPVNSQILLAEVGSTDVTERRLDDSFHVATLDNDAPVIFAESVDWLDRHASATGSPSESAASGRT